MSLADEIMAELEEKQEKMRNCDHQQITVDEDEEGWSCDECGHAFVRKDSNIADRLPEVENDGCSAHIVVDDNRSRVNLVASILERIGLDYDNRYTNSGGTFSRRGLEKLDHYLKENSQNSAEAGE